MSIKPIVIGGIIGATLGVATAHIRSKNRSKEFLESVAKQERAWCTSSLVDWANRKGASETELQNHKDALQKMTDVEIQLLFNFIFVYLEKKKQAPAELTSAVEGITRKYQGVFWKKI